MDEAKAKQCVKLTLEVQENNPDAQVGKTYTYASRQVRQVRLFRDLLAKIQFKL